jgi:altronate dehydratase small subunit
MRRAPGKERRDGRMSIIHAIVMKAIDNVATVVDDVEPDTDVVADINGKTVSVRINIKEKIPFGHKFALADIKKGEKIIKYGEVIGIATADIQPGQYVHVHNLDSCRGRGDM